MATDRSKKTRALQKKAEENVMLAHKYDPAKHLAIPGSKKDITDWWIYEKIDGVRAVFHKKDRQLVSRAGNKFYVPEEFIDEISFLGDFTFDGELVHSEGFQTTVSIVKDQSKKVSMDFWDDITYIIFDHQAPHMFRHRIENLNTAFKLRSKLMKMPHIKILQPLGTVKNNKDIASWLKKIQNKDGEGLMLRNPDATYEYGRSHNLLKVKEFIDIEATIIGTEKGEGRNSEWLGALTCKLDNDIEFRCGTGFSDEQRAEKWDIGEVITVRFFEYTEDGKPRFPVFVCRRDYE